MKTLKRSLEPPRELEGTLEHLKWLYALEISLSVWCNAWRVLERLFSCLNATTNSRESENGFLQLWLLCLLKWLFLSIGECERTPCDWLECFHALHGLQRLITTWFLHGKNQKSYTSFKSDFINQCTNKN